MESQVHIDLVKKIYEYACESIAEDNRCLIETDSSGNNSTVHVINNFVPDLFYSFEKTLIIGEAKTELDFERKHSCEQFDAYIKECNLFGENAMLIIGVPWQLCATAKNYFRRKKNIGEIIFSVIIIDELGRSFTI